MQNLKVLYNNYFIKQISFISKRKCSSSSSSGDRNKIRNIGILAHIDAGKTTTTERMLFYSGKIKSMGEVHHGNTVTDYLEQERERGITITSASVSFQWMDHIFHLIDTPGHIDFTMEVEQTLSVLDGAVVLLDASAGVEAQTMTVWRQANKYHIPRIVYINKTDRSDADIDMCIESLESKLETPAILLHVPIKQDGKLIGLIDIIKQEKLLWETTSERGKVFKRVEHENDPIIRELRNAAIDRLSGFDDDLANAIIQLDSMENIKSDLLIESLRKATLNHKVVPVLCGSSYKNIGIQPLMDSIITYLPSPYQSNNNKRMECFGNSMCGRIFKIMHHKQRGPLVFFRIYAGTFHKGQKIYNINQNVSEQTGRLLLALADDFQEVSQIPCGHVAVVTGLKRSITGDLITSNASAYSSAKKRQQHENLFCNSSRSIPEPVFFCSIEPPSVSYQTALENALDELQREDPSLRVTHNHETGQIVLSGMGELHLEIIRDRIKENYKIDTELGQLQIAYRETPSVIESTKCNHVLETRVGHTKHFINLTLSMKQCSVRNGELLLKFDKSPESASNLANLHPKHLLAIKHGLDVGINHGPRLGCPIVDVQFTLHFFEIGRGTSDTMISAAVTQTVQKLLNESGTRILEPIMHLEIVTPDEYVSVVLADLSRRRAVIQQIDIRGKTKIVNTLTPLADLMGYSTDLRTITSGMATFTMEFHAYSPMSSIDEANAIKNVQGF